MSGRFISYSSKNPYLNLAIEHAILQIAPTLSYDLSVRFWQNPPSVILGRTQILEEEVNMKYCKENNIPVLRRISGGGTVYHDYGNLNISFFAKKRILKGNFSIISISEYFSDIIIYVLKKIGVKNLEKENSTNIFSNDKKISGSAGYYRRGYYLHHATLLFNTNLKILDKVLLARTNNPDNKRKSRYFPTANIVNFDIGKLKSEFFQIFASQDKINLAETSLNQIELNLAEDLHHKLYNQDFWIQHGKRKLI